MKYKSRKDGAFERIFALRPGRFSTTDVIQVALRHYDGFAADNKWKTARANWGLIEELSEATTHGWTDISEEEVHMILFQLEHTGN